MAVPLSLVGTFAAMYALGYSLDNLSLMALTISTGFVVDDAIVMIENISRLSGRRPLAHAGRAERRGANRLHHSFVDGIADRRADPAAVYGGFVGRLFREFAVTLAVTIIISAAVSLTLTPMMCSRILRHAPESQKGRLYQASERVFERMIAFYGRTLKFVLDIRPSRCWWRWERWC